MQADLSSTTAVRGAAWTELETRPDRLSLRKWVAAAGIIWAALFVLIGLEYRLQSFADGAMFSIRSPCRMSGHFTGTTSRGACSFI
jgi:hypothetical protein